MKNWETYDNDDLFTVTCSAWDSYVREDFKVNYKYKVLMGFTINLEVLTNILNTCFDREDWNAEETKTLSYMGSVITGSKEFKKGVR